MPDLRVLPVRATQRVTQRATRRIGRRLSEMNPGMRLRQAELVKALPEAKATPEIKRPHTMAPVACFDQPIQGVVITILNASLGTC